MKSNKLGIFSFKILTFLCIKPPKSVVSFFLNLLWFVTTNCSSTKMRRSKHTLSSHPWWGNVKRNRKEGNDSIYNWQIQRYIKPSFKSLAPFSSLTNGSFLTNWCRFIWFVVSLTNLEIILWKGVFQSRLSPSLQLRFMKCWELGSRWRPCCHTTHRGQWGGVAISPAV